MAIKGIHSSTIVLRSFSVPTATAYYSNAAAPEQHRPSHTLSIDAHP